MLNFVQTLTLFLRSNHDLSWPSYLLIIIVNFHDQKASILLGNNQRKYITSRANSEQNLSVLEKYALHEKCPNTEFFFSHIFLYSDKKKLRIWTLFTQWWTETELFHEYFNCNHQFVWLSDTAWKVSKYVFSCI